MARAGQGTRLVTQRVVRRLRRGLRGCRVAAALVVGARRLFRVGERGVCRRCRPYAAAVSGYCRNPERRGFAPVRKRFDRFGNRVDPIRRHFERFRSPSEGQPKRWDRLRNPFPGIRWQSDCFRSRLSGIRKRFDRIGTGCAAFRNRSAPLRTPVGGVAWRASGEGCVSPMRCPPLCGPERVAHRLRTRSRAGRSADRRGVRTAMNRVVAGMAYGAAHSPPRGFTG